MKKYSLLLLLFCSVAFSQTNLDQILDIGIGNAEKFSNSYFVPAGESLVNAMSNGWFDTAEVKDTWGFNLKVVGSLSFVRKDKQTFYLHTKDYENITLPNGQTSMVVGNALGVYQSGQSVIINEGEPSELIVALPQGLSANGMRILPSGFFQGSIGLIKHTELKLRFLPKIKAVQEAEIQVAGIALQHEFTQWVYRLKRWPVHLSGLLAATNIKGYYDLNPDGTGSQEIELTTNSFLAAGIVSTKLEGLNFYAGLGYFFGNSEANLLGTYQAQSGSEAVIVKDPVTVTNNAKGVKATFGTRYTYKFLNANLDYSLQNYQTLTIGFGFGW